MVTIKISGAKQLLAANPANIVARTRIAGPSAVLAETIRQRVRFRGDIAGQGPLVQWRSTKETVMPRAEADARALEVVKEVGRGMVVARVPRGPSGKFTNSGGMWDSLGVVVRTTLKLAVLFTGATRAARGKPKSVPGWMKALWCLNGGPDPSRAKNKINVLLPKQSELDAFVNAIVSLLGRAALDVLGGVVTKDKPASALAASMRDAVSTSLTK